MGNDNSKHVELLQKAANEKAEREKVEVKLDALRDRGDAESKLKEQMHDMLREKAENAKREREKVEAELQAFRDQENEDRKLKEQMQDQLLEDTENAKRERDIAEAEVVALRDQVNEERKLKRQMHDTLRDQAAHEKREREKVAAELDVLKRDREDAERTLKRQMEFQWNTTVKYIWTEEEEENLRKEVLEEQRDSLGKKMKIKILVFGLTGHGKSTLLNGFRSAILGEGLVSHFHQTGSASTHGTYSLGFCAARYGNHLSIIDMGGIYESKAFKDEAIDDILTGKVPFYAKLTEHLQVEGKIDIPKPGKNDVSCVIIVMKPGTEFSTEIKRQFEVVDNLARRGLISRHLVLTHLDQTDPAFTDPVNLPKFVQSGEVQCAVKEMTERTGIPPSATSFVRNYVRENETNMYSNILLLKVLKNIIFEAKDSIERKIAQKQFEESDSD